MSDKYSETEASVRSVLATLWGIPRGTIAIAALVTIFGTAVILFVSIGAARLLEAIAPHSAYFIVAGFYALLLVVVLLLRRPLIADPVARLVTRLLVAPPADDLTDPSTSTSPDHADDTPRQ